MKIKDLSVGDEVAVGKPNELGSRYGARRAIVLATSGWELRKRYSWDTAVRENPNAKGFVAVAVCVARANEQDCWEPAVVRPQKVLATWADHQTAIVRNDQRRNEAARREAEVAAARAELAPRVKAVLDEAGLSVYVSEHQSSVTLSYTQLLQLADHLRAREVLPG